MSAEVIQLGQKPSEAGRGGAKYDAWIVVAMGGMIVLPAALTLLRVAEPRPGIDPSTNPTPLGYTWSLLLFVVPLVVIAWWFLRTPSFSFQRKSFWTTVAILVPLGLVLDLLFGTTFSPFSTARPLWGSLFRRWEARYPLKSSFST